MEDTRSREELINANARLLTLLEETTREVNQKKNLDFVQLYKKRIKTIKRFSQTKPNSSTNIARIC